MIDLRILGPLELVGSDGPVSLGRGRERALLARLAISNGEPVSVDVLVEDLWRGDAPPTAVKALQGHVSRLRRALDAAEPGGGAVLATHAAGYVLALDDEAIDRGRFERAIAQARESPADAAETLEAALSTWRGRALADVAYEPFAQSEIARLEELRAQAVEELAEAQLARGRHADALPLLEALTTEQPLRERPRAQLMLALYRSGRQSEALALYRDTRARLVEELAIEPGRELQELERRILAQDASLLDAATAVTVSRPPIEYARSGDVSIAYQLVGPGPPDLLWIRGHMSDLETLWEQPRFVSYVERLAGQARVILLEKRGTGMSDRPTHLPSLDERADDIRAVMDAAHSERAVLHASYEGCRLAILFAATHPERVAGLVLVDPQARGRRAPDYPWAPTDEEWEQQIGDVERRWGSEAYHEETVRAANPTASRDADVLRWFVRLMRRSGSPGAAAQFYRMVRDGDITDVLPSVHVPTLVLHQPRHAGAARFVADRIEGAVVRELPAEDGVYWLDEQTAEPWIRATLGFVAGVDRPRSVERALVVVVAAADPSPEAAKVVADHGGRLFEQRPAHLLAAFTAATQAVEAARALVPAAASRCAVSAGDCRLVDGVPEGQAVDDARAGLGSAAGGSVVNSPTVDAIVAASGLVVADA